MKPFFDVFVPTTSPLSSGRVGERLSRVAAARGGAAISFGVVALAWPGPTLSSLVIAFGVYMLIEAGVALGELLERSAQALPWGLVAARAALGIAIGAAVLLAPWTSGVILWYALACWVLATGLLAIVGATDTDPMSGAPLFTLGSGSLLLGLAMLTWPRAAAFFLTEVFGAYALVLGLGLFSLSFALRRKSLARAFSHS